MPSKRPFWRACCVTTKTLPSTRSSLAPATADVAFLAKRLIKRPCRAPIQPDERERPDPRPKNRSKPTRPATGRPRTFQPAAQPVEDESGEDPSATDTPAMRVPGWWPAKCTPRKPLTNPRGNGPRRFVSGPARIRRSAMQAQQLTGSLHWDRELPADAGEKLTLIELHRTLPRQIAARQSPRIGKPGSRSLVTRYWANEANRLPHSDSKLLALRADPGGAAGMLRLQAARSGPSRRARPAHSAAHGAVRVGPAAGKPA